VQKKCSDFNSEHGNRLEDYISGRLVCSDHFFDFSQKNENTMNFDFHPAQPHVPADITHITVRMWKPIGACSRLR